jgi:putative sigma-54 modulation protein
MFIKTFIRKPDWHGKFFPVFPLIHIADWLNFIGESTPGSLIFFHDKTDSMNLHIQTVHFDADQKLVEHVKEKIGKLEQFHDRIIKVDVFLKLDNVVHTIKDKIAEIRVHVPKADFFVKSTSKSFQVSFDEAFDSLVNQIKRKKEKLAA